MGNDICCGILHYNDSEDLLCLHPFRPKEKSPVQSPAELIAALREAATYYMDVEKSEKVLISIPQVIQGDAKRHEMIGGSETVAQDVVKLLAVNNANPSMCVIALKAIQVLCRYGEGQSTSCDLNLQQLSAANACSEVVSTLQLQGSDENVAEAGCTAIYNLCGNDHNAEICGEVGAIEVVTSLLRQHESHAGVAEHGCGALQNLCFQHSNTTRCGEAGACEVVLSLIATHETNAAVAAAACLAIFNLCSGDDQNTAQCSALGTCETLVHIISRHQTVPDVAEAGLMAISTLANDDNRKKLVDAGACELAVLLLTTHKLSVGVAENGCTVLYNLCYGNALNKTKCGKIGAIEAISTVLKLQNTVPEVVEW
eukprot:CAMPEP_0182431978 /NCGR_PEP_ID=MMETSP1167-20130531/53082_1 /TAXON_ID=2988 /ORGANISM="Mallomonas Sp, Strain CCMP3275" /LENGTH=369 /DNA_ID=CAMNT_0024618947 /DNA_START=82 /DNA_END=1188 /DNA_ORIENTATION=+